MLRRRKPANEGAFAYDGDDPKKQLEKSARARLLRLQVLLRTLGAAVLSALNPVPEVRSQEYSTYLTNKVKSLTIGWHIFRTITEGAFLMTYGLTHSTVVVQVFWCMSVASVAVHFLRRPLWLAWRETICVWTNITYAIITVLKIFHLVPRLPNENNYMFKHCFLTMADAAFSQTPVHKQYMIQFAEAVIRIIVWRRYNVLPDMPTWAVIAISLSWQVWLVTFSAMLQARNVSAFLRGRAAAASAAVAAGAATTSSSTPSSFAAADAARPSVDTPAPSSANAASAAAGTEAAAAAAASSTPAAPAAPVAPAATVAVVGAVATAVPAPRSSFTSTRRTPTASPRNSMGAAGGAHHHHHHHHQQHHHKHQHLHATLTHVAAGSGGGGGGAAALSAASTPVQRESGAALSPAQMRYVKALRAVARGPSSYVLLAHQRRQAESPQSATAQFYIPAASPDMLGGNWRERLATAVAEGAPGWQVANVCVRKGSLIVHLDLVYTGASAAAKEGDDKGAAATNAGAAAAAASSSPAARRGGGGGDHAPASSLLWDALPPSSTSAYSAAPLGAYGPESGQGVLDEYVSGMSAESLMQLLGLPLDLPGGGEAGGQAGAGAGAAQVVTVQLGARMRELPSAATTAATASEGAAAEETATVAPVAGAEAAAGIVEEEEPVGAASAACATAAAAEAEAAVLAPVLKAAAAESTDAPPAAVAPPVAAAAAPPPFAATLRRAVLLALRCPPPLRSPEYAAFLTQRVGRLHLAYSGLMCLTAAASLVVHPVNVLTMLLFLSAELLTWASYFGSGCCGAAWGRSRGPLVYVGTMLRTLQMAACTWGFLPHLLRDSDCESDRWVQKVVLVTTMQALCMQLPARTFFLVRLPSLLVLTHVHVFVCRSHLRLADAAALHAGWEGLMFVISAYLQQRHYEAFLKSREQLPACASAGKLACTAAAEDDAHCCASTSIGAGGTRDGGAASAAATCKAATEDAACLINERAAAAAAAPASPRKVLEAVAVEQGRAAAVPQASEAAAAVASDVPAEVKAAETEPIPAFASAFEPASAPGDPTSVFLSSPVVAMVPRRAAHLQLHFVCAPAVVDELQVVLRHVNPASMSSGVHAAHAVRDITHALVTPFGAAAAPAHVPAPFTVELTLVASPADMPGLVHVELWRGRRRVSAQPVLLAAKPPPQAPAAPAPAAATDAMSLLRACAARVSEAGGASRPADGGASWLDDVVSYVESLQAQGHGAAADQFVEELGGWLAQAAAMDRGLTAAAGAAGGSGAAGGAGPRVANVLYFHGYGSEFMYLKPKRLSNGGDGGGAAATAAGGAAGSGDPLQGTLRQLLLCQGSMLLAVSVEAAAAALSQFLAGLMVSQLGATLPGLLEEARTPVTQLPLLHAAVKSGSEQMVDLVAEWSTAAGLKDIWATEAAVLAVSLEAGAEGAADSATSTLAANNTGSSRRRSLLAGACDKPGGSSPYPPMGREHCSASAAPCAAADPQLRTPVPRGSRTLSDRSLALRVVAPAGDTATAATAAAAGLGALSSAVDMLIEASPFETPMSASSILQHPHLNSLPEDTPFKVITFRSSYRGAATAADTSPAACGAEGRATPDCAGSDGVGSLGTGGVGGCCVSSFERRRSLDSLVDGGVMVLTPLHLSLALGDGGRLASHILRTYPEAYELWRMSQPSPDLDFAPASASNAEGYSSSPSGADPSAPASSALVSTSASTGAADTSAFAPPVPPAVGTAESAPFPIGFGGAYGSMPGLGRRPAHGLYGCVGGGGGAGGYGGGVDAYDSMDVESIQSMSLSEVAFLEGMRWVDDEAAPRRGGFKVTRM